MKVYSDEVLLDYACGLGRWSIKLNKKFSKIVSIDISSELIKSLKNKRYNNINPIVGSDELLKIYNNKFDKIIFAQGLEFYKNPHNLLKKLHDSLKTDGELFLSTWTPELIDGIKGLEYTPSYVITSRPTDKKKIKVFCRLRTKRKIEELLKKARFEKIKVETITINTSKLPQKIKSLFGSKFNKTKNIHILIVAKAIKS